MFGWIDSVWNSVTGAVSGAVRDFVHTLVRGLYSFVHTIFGALWNAWNWYWDGVYALWAGAREFAVSVYHTFIRILKAIIPYLQNYIHWVRVFLGHVINVAVRALTDFINGIYHWALKSLEALKAFVINDVWNPLFKSLTNAWHWLTHEGATIWHYFTHLPQFATLLFWHLIAELERLAWDAGKALGNFFLSLIVHNVVRFATLTESIIASVLE